MPGKSMPAKANRERKSLYNNRTGYAGITNISSTIACVGLVDSIGFLQYIYGIDQTVFNLTIISIKILIFLTRKWNIGSIAPTFGLFSVITVGLFVSSAFNPVDLIDIIRVLMAMISILLTLAIIDGDIESYTVGLITSGIIISLLYIVQYRLGYIEIINGRSYFFGESHPNLGGEILSIILLLSTIRLRIVAFTFLFAISVYCCWLMQSRTSILAMGMSAILYYLFRFLKDDKSAYLKYLLLLIFACCISYLLIDAMTGSGIVAKTMEFLYNSVFLVEDTYRGAETGFSGRDLHWYQTFAIINDNFFVGAGVEYPRRLDLLQPHSWFLYPVALFGLTGYIIIILMTLIIAKVVLSNKEELTRVIPILIMLALNDRFMNLNINPLAIYVYLFARLYRPSISSMTPYHKSNFKRARLLLVNRRAVYRQPDIAARILARQRGGPRRRGRPPAG